MSPYIHSQPPLFSLAFSECEAFQEPVPYLLGADPINEWVEGRWQQQIDVREKDVHRLWDSVMTKAVCEVGEETRDVEGQNDTDMGTCLLYTSPSPRD